MKEIRLPKSSCGIQDSRQEAILLAKMKHPNIVAFRKSFEADGHLYIVMEYCDGGDLLEYIKHQKGKLLPEHKILRWFVQICLAVQHIHDKRVLHRDIKSKNIFLTQNGKIKLGDFGSARILTSPVAYACTYIGTPYYVPPEIWENMPYNNKSDIWSLGCVLYEMCTLKHPFQAGSWKNLILKICQGTYRPLPTQFSYELRSLVKQMFRRDPRHRPSANTILSRRSLSKLVGICMAAELTEEQPSNHGETEDVPIPPQAKDQALPQQDPLDIKNDPSSPRLKRSQWVKEPSNTVLNKLENASILTSSIASGTSTGGHVIRYEQKKLRRKWKKESPETLLNILKNADVSLAFKTYTIYRPRASENNLRGPLFSDDQAPDATDGIEEEISVDPERLESRSDDEDTDFEEEDVDPDWMSELKKIYESP
ncbi:serine/threonine-protein kinase Nek3 [Rhinophrynus dorsalis]